MMRKLGDLDDKWRTTGDGGVNSGRTAAERSENRKSWSARGTTVVRIGFNMRRTRGSVSPHLRDTAESSPASPAKIESVDDSKGPTPPSLKGEGANVAILLGLYFLQGVPIGLAASVPLFLKERVSLADIATFSFCSWPYGLKLLWAPIVDAVYSRRFGRRKSWIVPVQYLVGLTLLTLSSSLDTLLSADPPAIGILTAGFFMLYFLVATQDIAVDGWALTMLRPENVGFASTCNSVGQSLGYVVAYASFLAGTSPEFANRFRSTSSDQGAFTMTGYLQFWGVIFIIATTLLWWLKADNDAEAGGSAGPTQSRVIDAYKDMWSVVKLSNVKWLALVLLTVKMAYMTEGVVQFELMERGVTRDEILVATTPLVPLEVSKPRYTRSILAD